MSTFPRTIIPLQVSDLWSPGALKDISHSGLIQVRATKAVGWTWEERFGLLSVRNSDDMSLMAYIKKAWNRGAIFDITHPLIPGSGITPNGLGTAGVLVKGASQTGGTIITDAWPTTTSNCVRAGDALQFAGDVATYIVVDDASSDGIGDVSINISPNLRKSPADNAVVTTTGALFKAIIVTRSKFESSQTPAYFAGMRLVITEALV